MKQVRKIFSGGILSLMLLLSMLFTISTISMVQPIQTAANDLTGHLPATGEVNGSGVYGYTTNYVCYGGAMETQHKVEDGWHITLKNAYYSHGVQWFECWDTDDGDYYGWIDWKYITVYSSTPDPEPQQPIANIYSISNRRGEVDGNGVYGYTTNYVAYGGSKQTQHKVEDTWHITAKNQCTSYGVTWYECWDTDDGDYYGWIDANYLSFYDAAPPQTEAPKKTVVVEKTVLVTEAPKPVETVIVEKTVLVTESQTETVLAANAAAMDSTTDTTIKEENGQGLRLEENNNLSGNNPNNLLMIVLIAGIILLLIAIAILLMILYTKKMKSASTLTGAVKTNTAMEHSLHNSVNRQNARNPQQSENKAMYCTNCGTPRNHPEDLYCENCGAPYQD